MENLNLNTILKNKGKHPLQTMISNLLYQRQNKKEGGICNEKFK